MDCGTTSDGPKWTFSLTTTTTPPPQFSGACTDDYKSTASLPVPPAPELCGTTPTTMDKSNWWSLTSTSMSLGDPTPQQQEYQGLSEKGNNSAMREMIFRIAAMQPIRIDPESVKPPKRRNVKISKDPQSVAARHRRERISERIRILQRLVPGGTKMDIASMLNEAIHYLKFLQSQVDSLQRAASNNNTPPPLPLFDPSSNYLSLHKPPQPPHNPHHYFSDA